jgi:hypothetical protein
MAFYSGKLGSISVGGTTQPLTDWSMDTKVDLIDVTNFGSSGVTANEAGIASAEISASGPYDGSAGAAAGDNVVFILAVSSVVGAPSFTVTARISSIKIDQSVKDVAKVSYSATSNGTLSGITV